MVDFLSKPERSARMSAIRSRGNKSTELRMIKFFRASKIRGWKRNYRLLGRPDFVFPKSRFVLFVDGCFWHGCSRCYKEPSSNISYWKQKVLMNRARDRRITNELKSSGWTVVRIWEHEIRGASLPGE